MKRIILALAFALGVGLSTQAQLIFQPLFNVDSWVIDAGYAHSISGVGRNIAEVSGVYNIAATTNGTGAGIVIGGDYLWKGGGSHQTEILKGGLEMKTSVKPLVWTGISWLTNRTLYPWGGILLATPKGSGANVGTLTLAGADFDLYHTGQFSFSIDGFYENRSGQAEWDGNYVGGFFAIARNKYKLELGYGTTTGMTQSPEITGPQIRLSRSF